MKVSAGPETVSQHRGKGFKSRGKASYVDETLFGSHRKYQTTGWAFDSPWRETRASGQPEAREMDSSPLKSPLPASTPRKRNKYRLKSHMPSYCDETLFGPKAGGQERAASRTVREDVARLCPFLWISPSASLGHPVLPHHTKGMPKPQGNDRSVANWGAGSASWKKPGNDSDTGTPAARGHFKSVTRPSSTSEGLRPPRLYRQQDRRAAATSAGGLPGSLSARATNLATVKEKPPWK